MSPLHVDFLPLHIIAALFPTLFCFCCTSRFLLHTLLNNNNNDRGHGRQLTTVSGRTAVRGETQDGWRKVAVSFYVAIVILQGRLRCQVGIVLRVSGEKRVFQDQRPWRRKRQEPQQSLVQTRKLDATAANIGGKKCVLVWRMYLTYILIFFFYTIRFNC